MALVLSFACPACGAPAEGEVTAQTRTLPCPACGVATALPEAEALGATRAPAACPVCGGTDLYRQKDFSRRVGLAIAAAGLLAGPFTAWISTVAAIGLDAALYLVVPDVAVCYACEAQVRGFDARSAPPPFDIAIHDAYKFGKRFPPRRERAVAGPLARRVEFDARRRAIQG